MGRWANGVLILWLALLTALPPVYAGAQPHRPSAVRSDIRLAVQVAASGLGGLVARVQRREERIALIRDYVAKARFFPDGQGYLFVYDRDGVCVAHGSQPELEGRSLIGLKDPSGFAVVRALVETGLKGGGYVEYVWPKPGMEGEFEKLGYVERIPGTDFIIGSGLYYVDIQ